MYNRVTRRRKVYVLIFIVVVFAALWLLLQPRPTSAHVLTSFATDVRLAS